MGVCVGVCVCVCECVCRGMCVCVYAEGYTVVHCECCRERESCLAFSVSIIGTE